MITVAATTPSSSHPVPGSVRSLVHSAYSALLMRSSGGAGPWPGRVRPRPTGTARRARPTARAGKTVLRRIHVVHLRVGGDVLLDREPGGRGDPQQPVRGARVQH